MNHNLTQNDRYYRMLRWVILVLTAGLAVWIRPAADDFYYMTFTDDGWSQFWENHLVHYQLMSGRVFVHLLLNPLLLLDMWPFRVFFVGLIALFAVLTAKLCAPEGAGRPAAAALAVSVFWLQGIETLVDGALWGAGTMNYLFPLTLVALYAVLLQRFLDGSGGVWICLPAFLCACTVEMNGILPIVIFLYLCLTRREDARARGWRTWAVGLATLAGYLFLFTSPGLTNRLSNNASGLSLLEKILCNYALIDRKAVGPEGIWAIVALALASCGGVLLGEQKRGLAMAFLTGAGAVTLTGLGIVYDGIAVAVIAICAFVLLALFAVGRYRLGEHQVPMWMLCATISLGVCLVSPVMGARLIMPTGMMLAILFVRNMQLLRLPEGWRLRLTALIAAAACVLLVDYTVHSMENARIVDENTRLTGEYDGGGILELSLVPDDIYAASNVPGGSNFGAYYLMHNDLTDVRIICTDPTAADVLWDGGVLEQTAVLRDGQYYIPIRAAADICGSTVRWELASAVVEHEEELYCFHMGNRAVNLGHGICSSEKLQDPVRSFEGKVRISVRDFENLFGVELTVIPADGN